MLMMMINFDDNAVHVLMIILMLILMMMSETRTSVI